MNAYFDIFSGISGNMVLGALLDLGLDYEEWKEELKKLGLEGEYNLINEKTEKNGIEGRYFQVELVDNKAQGHNHHSHEHHDHDHEHSDHDHSGDGHSHEHSHSYGRNLEDINNIIDNSAFSSNVKEKAKAIFLNLAKAEAKIHGEDINEIHFHEVGAVDAIIDIVGSVLGLEMLGIDKIYSSKLHIGTGFVNCDHGKMPVPAPATMELLEGLPVYSIGIEAEMVTPTGAAIISTLAESFGERKEMKIIKSGYGAGSRDLPIPNLLRVNLIEEVEKSEKNEKKTQ